RMSMATISRPLASMRERMVPVSPRRTPSGLMRKKVLSVTTVIVTSTRPVSVVLAGQIATGDPAGEVPAQVQDVEPHHGEQDPADPHRPVHHPAGHRERGEREVERDRPRPALESTGDDHRHGQQAHEPHLPRLEVLAVVDPGDHREHQADHDRLEDERAGHDPPQALPRVDRRRVALAERARPVLPVRRGLLCHCASFPKRVRTAPAVTTDPVTSTPTPEVSSSAVGSGTPTRSSAALTASARVSTTWTRWAVKRSSAIRASSSASSARGEDARVTTTSSTTGSSAARNASVSFPSSMATTATRRRKSNSEVTASARARPP